MYDSALQRYFYQPQSSINEEKGSLNPRVLLVTGDKWIGELFRCNTQCITALRFNLVARGELLKRDR